MKSCILLAETGVRKVSSVAGGFSSFKIHYSVKGINKAYVFSYSDILLKTLFVSLQSNLLLTWFLRRQRHVITEEPRCTLEV